MEVMADRIAMLDAHILNTENDEWNVIPQIDREQTQSTSLVQSEPSWCHLQQEQFWQELQQLNQTWRVC